jgi:putative ABC transport system permease protein
MFLTTSRELLWRTTPTLFFARLGLPVDSSQLKMLSGTSWLMVGHLLVNQAFANRFFPRQDVLGKHLELMGDSQPDREIVGVVGNISHRALKQVPP